MKKSRNIENIWPEYLQLGTKYGFLKKNKESLEKETQYRTTEL